MPLKNLLHVKAFLMRLVIHFEKTLIQKNTSVDIKNTIRFHELSLQKLQINIPKPSSNGWYDNYPFLKTQHLKPSEKLEDLSEQEDLLAIRKLLKQDLPHPAIEQNNQGEMSLSGILWSEAKQGSQSPSECLPAPLPVVEPINENDLIDSIMEIKPIIQPMPIEAKPDPQKNN